MNQSGLLTDLYELTMMQGYLLNGKNEKVVFDMFFRKQPFDGGYSVFAGIEKILSMLPSFTFSEDDINYLKSLDKFKPVFLDYLRNFRFSPRLFIIQNL